MEPLRGSPEKQKMQVTPMTVKVTGETFKSEVLESLLPVLVEFYASWCGKCAMMEDVVAEFAVENAERIKVCQIDTDQNKNLAAEFGVKKVPTFVSFRAGKPVRTVEGVVTGKVLGRLFE